MSITYVQLCPNMYYTCIFVYKHTHNYVCMYVRICTTHSGDCNILYFRGSNLAGFTVIQNMQSFSG